MFTQHLVELFLQNIPEELAVVFTASVFLKVKIDKFKIILLGIISGIIVHLIRILPLSFGFHTIIMIFIFALLFSRFYNKKFSKSFIAVIKTLFLVSIFEVISINTYMYFSGTPLHNVRQNMLLVSILMLPQTILIFLVGLIIIYYRHQQGVHHDQKNSKYFE